MKLKILPKVGGVLGQAIVLDASLVVVEMDDGTPVMVSGEFGPEGAVRSSHAGDTDFIDTLRQLGIDKMVIVDTLKMPPPPPGARILTGPRPEGA
jgi:hypothetical protein